MRQQLGSDTVRNTGVETSQVGTDLQHKGYRALPNERDVTTLRNYTSNLVTDEKAPEMGIMDEIKKTVKETTINSKNNGYLANTSINSTVEIQDDVRVKKKQTTINTKHNGNIIGGLEKPTAGVEKPETTMKDLGLYKHFGVAGGVVQGDMEKDNFRNAETNPIAQGREPINVKIANGRDTVNITIDKIENDYMNQRVNGIDKGLRRNYSNR